MLTDSYFIDEIEKLILKHCDTNDISKTSHTAEMIFVRSLELMAKYEVSGRNSEMLPKITGELMNDKISFEGKLANGMIYAIFLGTYGEHASEESVDEPILFYIGQVFDNYNHIEPDTVYRLMKLSFTMAKQNYASYKSEYSS